MTTPLEEGAAAFLCSKSQFVPVKATEWRSAEVGSPVVPTATVYHWLVTHLVVIHALVTSSHTVDQLVVVFTAGPERAVAV